MKLSAFVLLVVLALPAWPQTPTPSATSGTIAQPGGANATPNGANASPSPVGLPPEVVKAIQDALAAAASAKTAAVAPAAPASPAVSPSACSGEAAQFFSMGGGINGLGPAQPFGYLSVSQHVACGTYATTITEFARMPGGLVGTSARAGVSKTLWNPGNLIIGIVGDAGAAEGTTGSASGSVSARGFAALRFFKSAWHVIATAETLKIAGTGSQTVISLGVGYGAYSK